MRQKEGMHPGGSGVGEGALSDLVLLRSRCREGKE